MKTADILHSYFKGRTAVLATMHQKEKVIAPILEESLGVKVIVPENLNTDSFGTFTREVERKGSQLEAARFKAQEAMDLTGETLAFASEGTFGPHPAIPFLPFNRELVILLDRDNDLEIVGVAGSTETNHGEKTVTDFQDAVQYALKQGFPQHGMIVRGKDTDAIFKGITSKDQLQQAFSAIQKVSNEVIVESDMRAMYNPTRMKTIESATHDLVTNIYNICPKCHIPGFALTERKKGLPCAWCNLPTQLIRSEVYTCKKCGESEERPFPRETEKADPGECAHCNP